MSEEMLPWVLIPVKSLEAGKSRLAQLLTGNERRELNAFFLRRTIEVAADEVLDLARSFGVHAIGQGGEPGLNRAAMRGCEQLRSHGALEILILPIDLPLVRALDLREIAALGRRHRMIICPDRNYVGTNALFLPSRTSLQFRFGGESCMAHWREAQHCGLAPLIHFNPRIAADVDVPEDLTGLFERYGSDLAWPAACCTCRKPYLTDS